MMATRGEAGRRGERHGRAGRTRLIWLATFVVVVALATLGPLPAQAHPLGNFSISHYAGIRVEQDDITLLYLIDMAEIPTFQEIQETGIVPEAGHPTLRGYLAKKAEGLKEGLFLEINGQRLPLQPQSTEVIFPPGAGGLPTMKLGILYRTKLDGATTVMDLRYKDANFEGRAGWKEIVAVAGAGITLMSSSVLEQDRSRQLANYPTDLLDSPPQDLEARLIFQREGSSQAVAILEPPEPPETRVESTGHRPVPTTTQRTEPSSATNSGEVRIAPPPSARAVEAQAPMREPLRLQVNRQATPRNSFTELVATKESGVGIILIAIAVALGLGAFHALEPGHGKTVVAAYLVGSRGTAWHALILGIIVTASHTAGVYLLGAVTLYASRYVVPDRLYPWLGVISGLTIAGLGCFLFLRRYAGATHPHSHDHGHEHGHIHHHGHSHGPEGQALGADSHHHHERTETVSLRQLLTLGISGGIIPCPAALVVLLSALSLHRVGFGLLLIVAFSVGLAAVLVAMGLLVVYARRLMSRFHSEGPLLTRWLPLTSSTIMTLFGVAIAVQALATAGILQIRL